MKKIIFDCDNTMGIEGCDVDDGLALLYLLGKGDIEICGITVTYGNSDLDTVYSNTQAILKEIGRTDIRLLKGCPGKDVLRSEASDFIVETVKTNRKNISILATGSLTNLYAAYLSDNTVFENVCEIVVMGGITEDLRINGRILEELNFSCDPVAAECVLKNGNNLSVITGNNCLKAFFSKQDFKDRLLASDKPAARYIAQKCKHWFDEMMSAFHLNGFYNWDVVAAAFLANPALFDNHFQYIAPNYEDLSKGRLSPAPEDHPRHRVNTPVIREPERFIDDVYSAWLSLDL